jgi:excisionase family DNA binding protein
MINNSNPLPGMKFMTVKEIATEMRLSKMTVYRLIEAKKLPSVRIGSSFRVPQKAVTDYIRNNTTVEF